MKILYVKLISILFVLIFLFNASGQTIKHTIDASSETFAATKNTETELQEIEPVDITQDRSVDIIEESPYIEYEDVRARDIDKRQYYMSDGTILVEQFAEPVHYLEDGQYKEIDNSLIAIKDKDGEEKLKNAGNNFDVVLSKNYMSEKNLIKINKNDYEIAFTPVDIDGKQEEADTVIESSLDKSRKRKVDYKNKKLSVPVGLEFPSSKIKYRQILKDIDIEYEIQNNAVKENIIINKKQNEYKFEFKMNVKNLFLNLQNDGSIIASNYKNKPIFIIPAPFMTDANNEYSQSVYYDLLISPTDEYTLIVNADKEWINREDILLPVKIDPIVYEYNTAPFVYANIFQNSSTVTTGTEMYIGRDKNPGLGLSNGYIKFNIDSTYFENCTLMAGGLKYTRKGINALTYYVGIVDSNYNNSSLTYSKRPSAIKEIGSEDVNNTLEKTLIFPFDLANIEDCQVAFGFSPKYDIISGRYAKIYVSGTQKPSLLLKFKMMMGLENGYRFESVNLKNISNHINVLSRNLTTEINYMDVNSNIMPLSVRGIYNCGFYNYKNNIFPSGSNFRRNFYGKDFKLNFEQYCVPYDFDLNGINDGYLYIDADGTPHRLRQQDSIRYACEDCNINYKTSGWLCVNDRESLYFSGDRLNYIKSNEGQTIRLLYNGDGSIYKIYNCVNSASYTSPAITEAQSILFGYTNGLLSSMTSNYGSGTSFIYDSNQYLKNVIQNTHTIASINYMDSTYWKISDIYDINGNGYSFSYDHASSNNYFYSAINTVKGFFTKSSSTQILNGSISFTGNGIARQIKYSSFPNESYTNYYYYNEKGECVNEYGSYDEVQSDSSIPKQIRTVSSFGGGNRRYSNVNLYEENLKSITNGTFQSISGKNPTGWTITTDNTENNYGGNEDYYLKLFKDSSATTSFNFVREDNHDYVLSFFAQGYCKNCTIQVNLITSENIICRVCFFSVSYNGRYISLDMNYSPAKIEIINTCRACNMGYIKIDNISISSLNSYTSSSYAHLEDSIAKTYTPTSYSKVIYDKDNRQTSQEFTDIISSRVEKTEYTYDNMRLLSEQTKDGNQTIIRQNDYQYDNRGLVTKTVRKEILNGVTSQTVSAYEYDQFGFATKITDPDGIVTINMFGKGAFNNYMLLNSTTGNYSESYSYDILGRLINTSNGYSYNAYNYESNGNMDFEGRNYTGNFDLDDYGNLKNITKAGSAYTSILYNYDSNQNLTRKDYVNSPPQNIQTANYTYDNYGDIASIIYKTNETTDDTYTFSTDISTKTGIINSNGLEYKSEAEYGGNPLKSRLTISGGGYNAYYDYTAKENGILSSASYVFGGITRNQSFIYTNDWKLKTLNDVNFRAIYDYNKQNKIEDYIITNDAGKEIINLTYSHKYASINSESSYTSLVSHIFDNKNFSNTLGFDYDNKGNLNNIFKYEIVYVYDSNGNIINAYQITVVKQTYSYDNSNKLITEENLETNTKYTYTYDSNYNIKSAVKIGASSDTMTYYYGANSDLLTSYTKDGLSKYFEYDNMGNPIKYKVNSTSDANNMVWSQGRKLKSGLCNGKTFAYKYDANGIRYQKTVNGLMTRYYLEGSRIIGEERLNASGAVTDTLYYIYDLSGIAGMVYNGNTYFFRKNVFGDVIDIYNYSGTTVANYTYDAWGNCSITTNINNIANINPFRYRGYYWDNETGFYYLQSRYYDPEIRRFINADDLEIIPELAGTVGQLNLYAYCNNNPVMYTDETGYSIFISIEQCFRMIGKEAKEFFSELPSNLVETGEALFESIEVDLGIGTGFGFEVELFVFSLSLLSKADMHVTQSGNGELFTGTEVGWKIGISFLIWGLAVGSMAKFSESDELVEQKPLIDANISVGGSFYFIFGFEGSISWNYEKFSNRLNEIWR